jgi:hypothetical protein
MNAVDFKELIGRFTKYPIPGRKLFVWVGNRETLVKTLPVEITKEIDLIKLIRPIASDTELNAERTIKSVLFQLVKSISLSNKTREILVIENAYLIARYRISLTPFYDYYLGDRTMAIFQIPKVSSLNELPNYIEYNPSLVLEYFKKILPEEHKQNIILEGEK